MKPIATFILLFSIFAAPCLAQVDLPDVAPPPAAPHVDTAPAYTHPTVPSSDAVWPGAVLLVVIGMFLAAAVIGPIVRMEMPEEIPLQSHDEPPGSSHHHGPSGTVQPGPEHELPGGHGHH
jgi:hypothetical protein